MYFPVILNNYVVKSANSKFDISFLVVFLLMLSQIGTYKMLSMDNKVYCENAFSSLYDAMTSTFIVTFSKVTIFQD